MGTERGRGIDQAIPGFLVEDTCGGVGCHDRLELLRDAELFAAGQQVGDGGFNAGGTGVAEAEFKEPGGAGRGGFGGFAGFENPFLQVIAEQPLFEDFGRGNDRLDACAKDVVGQGTRVESGFERGPVQPGALQK